MDSRAITARRVRTDAAELAAIRAHPEHHSNGDEQRFRSASYPMNFTKGLEHDPDTGLVANPAHFEAFRAAIDSGRIGAFTHSVPVPSANPRRKWEAPTAGVAYDLQGPDAQAVTMPPAPAFCSEELAFEMAEVYELAMLRDVPFFSFDQNGGSGSGKLNDAISRLSSTPFAQNGYKGRPRKTDASGNLTRQTVFRGSSPGVEVGPYLSVFMHIGNADRAGTYGIDEGLVNYGAICLNQRIHVAQPQTDYMQVWADWLHVQNGYEVPSPKGGQSLTGDKRFIYTPRDLATYVHYDALYEAYLNACLILLAMGAPLDPGFGTLGGHAPHYDHSDETALNSGGFALYGGPHILTLVTEVATRALKAVRFQKFNNHIRARPEVLAARIEKESVLTADFPSLCTCLPDFCAGIDDTVQAIRAFNQAAVGDDTALLPMAFAEGSPMHPAYGAGHATVAGACVTMLKAFFDTGAIFGKSTATNEIAFFNNAKGVEPMQVEAKNSGNSLDISPLTDCVLTLEGELNKLAANISIGRNMAGVHYFSDYYDSLRMGEKIAIGMLEEQALCYPTDEFVLSLPTFDGQMVRIGRR